MDGLTKSPLQVTSSAGTNGDKKTKRKADVQSNPEEEEEFNVQLGIDEKEQALFAQEVEDETW